MISYSNYVDQERKNKGEDTEAPPLTSVVFEKGPGNLPLLPPEVKGVRGMEVAQQAKEIIRTYFLCHYRKFYLSF